MSGKLDKSLDEILTTTRPTNGRKLRRGTVRRSGPAGKAAPIAPAGGIKKNPRTTRGGAKPIPTGPSGNGEGKIQVSGFPKDITEAMIKEYFAKTVGAVKRVDLSYGPRGESRGVADITFVRSDSATRAVESCNNIPVDGKPIKVSLILDANRAKSIPAPKGLSERITLPKSQPKSAAATKTAAPATRGAKTRGRGGRGGGARGTRPAKKTAEELDSEMVDYWQTGATATEGAVAGTAQAANGDANMDDEIMVRLTSVLAGTIH
ncbi:protein mlo3-like protein [Drepanopeziza brunnea f. sp. 'multigermtubi' MB_m1]|uniref:Protein mlo3-like protein n=1 Tax=Marssonina brunnea f. sp. multigermtubi (strain MB_m1) TaxID=1072389 RepID=K1XIF8_MARBU|nr:protein mlo3-like protein [Drepanopeziza brunnea f. sp. 'multigermtubi' MB_m1]EKD12224.1 protein mlo3-like protein [Drepanopeziza brunnea f. sp. 'multigermtubi' MB_m1]